jgi:hypothetical protein
MIETLGTQGTTVLTARGFSGGRPAVISPITLTSRVPTNPAGPNDPTPAGLWPFQHDERLAQPFAAAWMLGSVAATAAAGVASLTYFEAHGENGIIGPSGATRPLSRVFELLGLFAHASVCRVLPSHPTSVAALALDAGERRALIAATFNDTPQLLRVSGAWGTRQLTLTQQPTVVIFP